MSVTTHDFRGNPPPIVLLIDRDPDERDRFVRSLEDAGLWVATSRGPIEALTAVQELNPDIVVADADVEDASADAELITVLRRNRDLGRVPFILMTSRPEAPTPADSVLIKPVQPSVLVQRTHELLARSQRIRARSRDVVAVGARLVEQSSRLVDGSARLQDARQERERPCPKCGRALEWVMQDAIGGVNYDYYRWCLGGCGLYCFDRDRLKWIKLA